MLIYGINITKSHIINPEYFLVPKEGTPVPSNIVKRAGPYLLGPTLGSSPVKSIVQCLARKEGTDDFYTLKVSYHNKLFIII